MSFPYSCDYVVRLDGPDGYEHYGHFLWDYATKRPSPATGVSGDLPATLGRGTWTFSFAFVHRGDVVSEVPVAGGTPRAEGLAPREVGCTQRLQVTDELSDRLDVAFAGDRCTVLVETATP